MFSYKYIFQINPERRNTFDLVDGPNPTSLTYVLLNPPRKDFLIKKGAKYVLECFDKIDFLLNNKKATTEESIMDCHLTVRALKKHLETLDDDIPVYIEYPENIDTFEYCEIYNEWDKMVEKYIRAWDIVHFKKENKCAIVINY